MLTGRGQDNQSIILLRSGLGPRGEKNARCESAKADLIQSKAMDGGSFAIVSQSSPKLSLIFLAAFFFALLIVFCCCGSSCCCCCCFCCGGGGSFDLASDFLADVRPVSSSSRRSLRMSSLAFAIRDLSVFSLSLLFSSSECSSPITRPTLRLRTAPMPATLSLSFSFSNAIFSSFPASSLWVSPLVLVPSAFSFPSCRELSPSPSPSSCPFSRYTTFPCSSTTTGASSASSDAERFWPGRRFAARIGSGPPLRADCWPRRRARNGGRELSYVRFLAVIFCDIVGGGLGGWVGVLPLC